MGAMIYIVIRNKGWLGDLSARQILVMAFFLFIMDLPVQEWTIQPTLQDWFVE